VGNARSLESALGRATHRSNVFGKALRTLAVVGVGAAVVGLQQSVKAALEAEASQSRLQQAFKNSHLSLSRYTKSLESTEKAARALGFGDNDVRESLGSLMTATDSYKKSLTLLTVAQNIARFKGVSLVDATKMLTMAMTGSQRATKALGLIISPVTQNVDKLKKAHEELSKAEQAATAGAYKHELAQAKLQDKMATGEAVIAAVTKKTQGMADAYGKTAAGNIEQFKAEFEHLKAELGRGLLPILSAGTSKLTGFVSQFETHIPELRAQFGGFAQVVGTAGKALVSFGSSRVGQSALAGLATTFVGSGLVGEVHSFIDLLKTMNPVLIGVGAAAGIFGGVLYAIMTSTGGMTRELLAAKEAIDGVKKALNDSAQAGQNLVVARHQLTGAEIAYRQAAKITNDLVKAGKKGSDEYKQALNNENQALDSVKQGHLNLKNAHQAVRQTAVAATAATLKQTQAFKDAADRAEELWHGYDAIDNRSVAYQKTARASALATTGFATAQQHAAALDFAGYIQKITHAMGGTKEQANQAGRAVVALAIALGRLPTRKEINIIVTEQQRASSLSQRGYGYGTTPSTRPRRRRRSAAGGVVEGGTEGVDSVPILAMPGEIIFNPRNPARGEAALEEIGFTRMQGGGRVHRRHRGGRRPSERRAEKRARASDTVPLNIEYAISSARNRHDNVALLAALKAKERWLIRHIGITRSLANKIALTDELTSVQDEIASLSAAPGAEDRSADLQAQLDQANARLGGANLAARLANAFVSTGVFGSGSGGGGGGWGGMPGFGFYELSDSRMLGRAAGAIATGFGNQGFRPATTERLGV
jgi:hypothetical protein